MRESDHRITRALVRSGVLVAQEYDDEEQLWLDLDPEGEDALTQLQGATRTRARSTRAMISGACWTNTASCAQ